MVIEWRPLIVGILFTLAIYAVSVLSSQSAIALLGLLLGGAVVGVMIGGEIKDSLINGLIFGVITSIIIFIVTVIEILTSALGSAILGLYTEELLLILGIEIVLALVGSVLGSYIRSEALMTDD
ncbi:MAG: DUF5518 domain-containing protein [Methanobacterium sp.]